MTGGDAILIFSPKIEVGSSVRQTMTVDCVHCQGHMLS